MDSNSNCLLHKIIEYIMNLSIYNTLERKTEIFQPEDKNSVKLYVCGPTVYDHPHIGNARSVVVYDLLFRLLKYIYGENKVYYVRNITDVDDKIIERAKELKLNVSTLTERTISSFHQDMKYLNTQMPNAEPRATEHIQDMIDMIQKLLVNNVAYISENHVYFEVKKSPNYTELSGRSFEDMISEVRLDHSPGKRNPEDFVLWKPAKKSDQENVNFQSPWGSGRPGWHIECSAMSYKFLGNNFDIHGGGADLIFPHHTNEIAQSVCAYPDSNFAKYWMHNGFLTVNKQKMSKSLGNFVTIKNLRDARIDGEIVRFFLLSTHYRKPLDYNENALANAQKTLEYLKLTINSVDINYKTPVPCDFLEALLDDFNISVANSILHALAKKANAETIYSKKAKYASELYAAIKFLGFSRYELQTNQVEIDYIQNLITLRETAKEEKDWQLADQIRSKLKKQNIYLQDNINGTTSWIKK